jgi:hypothetical protein
MIELIIENKELLKFIYTFAIALICAVIVVKTDRLFHLSLHQGIRYLRNAFFFFGFGFILRSLLVFNSFPIVLLKVIFEFFIIMAGFFLLYSLLWKRLESQSKNYTSSLLNPKIFLFYSMALIIALVDSLLGTYLFMFLSQIIIFAFASVISFRNYSTHGKEHKFLKSYFIAMLLSFVAWSVNTFAALYLWRLRFVTSVYIINIVIFLLFLYGIIKVTKK